MKNKTVRPAVLVSGVSGDSALGIIKGLRESSLNPIIIGVDRAADCGGYHLCDAWERVPSVRDSDYLSTIKNVVEKL